LSLKENKMDCCVQEDCFAKKRESLCEFCETLWNQFRSYFFALEERGSSFYKCYKSVGIMLQAISYLADLQIEASYINQQTYEITQRDSKWFLFRSKRLTASKFGAVHGVDPTWPKRNPEKLILSFLWPPPSSIPSSDLSTVLLSSSDLSSSSSSSSSSSDSSSSSSGGKSIAMNHGVIHEKDGLSAYMNWKSNQLMHNALELYSEDPSNISTEETIRIHTPGFLVSERWPWLGASPDFITEYEITKIATGETEIHQWLGEIKCPFPAMRGPNRGIAKPYEKIPHHYYDQIQGSMGILGLLYCDFVIWTEQRTVVERYLFDEDYFYNELLPCLQKFYLYSLLPRFLAKERGEIPVGLIDTPLEI
jgi:hypothetical protein